MMPIPNGAPAPMYAPYAPYPPGPSAPNGDPGFQNTSPPDYSSTYSPAYPSSPPPPPGGSNSPYGINQVSVQTYIPISSRRRLSGMEVYEIQQNQQQNWVGKLFPSYLTPLPRMMANPAKFAALSALGGAISGLFLSLFTWRSEWKVPLTALFVGGGAALSAFTGYLGQKQRNENLADMMTRFPPGATKRDMLADPAVQADLNRSAMVSSGYNSGFNGTTALLAGSMLGASMASRRNN